jgi:arylsulfatase A-like enzyme
MMDLAPTILRMTGAEASRPPDFLFDGRSVLERISDPSMGDEGHDRTILLEAGDEGPDVGWLWRGLVTNNRKYAEFVNGDRLLFDRELDPHEETNLVRDRPGEVGRLHTALMSLEQCAGDSCRVADPI